MKTTSSKSNFLTVVSKSVVRAQRFAAAIALAAASFTFPPGATAQDSKPNAETWVLDQVSKGEIADLSSYSESEEERVLSTAFLRELLTQPPRQA